MSHKLIDLNDDLRQLRDEGYNVDIDSGWLIVRDVPYVNNKRKIVRGILGMFVDEVDGKTQRPSDHTAKFGGEMPCTSEGHPLSSSAISSTNNLRISERVILQYQFSNKPTRGHYENLHEKVVSYVGLLLPHARAIDPNVTARTYQVVKPHEEDSPFAYADAASAKAEINMITKKIAVEKIAIVGIGGTGSYVLDLLAKTPAKEIHLFDGDKFSPHNAFRAPGAASKEDLKKQPLKVDYFKERYSKLHLGIKEHGENIGPDNIELLRGMTCVFLCIDSGPGKKFIVEKLEEFEVLFIDVGMGIYATNETLGGILRITTSEPDNRSVAKGRLSFADTEEGNEYDKNIQIADLNSLNAALAIIRWKKLRGFYFDFTRERYSSYTVGTNRLLSEDIHESHSDN
ncbi:ThiF family adenylyltransferase [Bradyrhizobium brasilense]|uniref:ThiF family adenylyltransferase n=1 Tax=Bradyrhizobium brasilense TaxID=1419277 RepID=UPI0024B27DFA|nr:ThiF family adenylyltransferase [Bradyrhizobium australafricanum]WFU32394.1 ThiF family adenylyltransferase [Bradyrhizobium australafricanum]